MARQHPDITSSDRLPLWSLALPGWATAPASSTHLPSRLRVRLRQRVLDREIASGLLEGDADRVLRGRQITSPAERHRVAALLANILDAAEERHADPASPLKLNHAEVLAARHGIVALITTLRSDRRVNPRGVALARALVDDGRSPLLRARAGRTVERAVSEAATAL